LDITVKDYADLAHRLSSGGTIYGSGSTTGAFIPEFSKTPVFREYLHWYRTGDPSVFRWLYSFLLFLKKADIPYEHLSSGALRSWRKVEDDIASIQLDSNTLDDLKDVMSVLLDDFSIGDQYYVHHGPGAVAEPGVRGFIAKTARLAWNPKLDIVFSTYLEKPIQGMPMRKFLFGNSWEREVVPLRSTLTSQNTSVMIEVPKDLTKNRTISKEPLTTMFFQQVVKDSLYDLISKSRAGRYIRLQDQTYNQSAAKSGSIYGHVDTLDLSSASDRVLEEVVRAVFPRKLLKYLLGTRSRFTRLPDGSLFEQRKFAPMGSALCFPVQSLLFLSVVVLEYLRDEAANCGTYNEGGRIGYSTTKLIDFVDRNIESDFDEAALWPRRTRYSPIAVFGDDIICDARVTEKVISTLVSLGLEVNISKSFKASQIFRESCGAFWLGGEDVTPLRFRVKYFTRNPGVDTYASLVSMINRVGDFGYRVLQSFLIRETMDVFKGVPFTADRDAFGIYSKDVRNHHLKKRSYNPSLHVPCGLDTKIPSHIALQRDEVRSQIIVSKQRDRGNIDHYAYLQWWRSRARDISAADETQSAMSRVYPWEAGIAWGWTPER
jgi:hypothetical protein